MPAPAGPEGFVPSVEAWRSIAAAPGPAYPLGDVHLEAPVVPSKLVCIGLNYRDHAEETGQEIPSAPVVFAKFTSALIGPGEAIVVPYDEPRTDYEAELALVIGTRVRRVTGAAALAAIGGITAFNDVSGREAQFGPGQAVHARQELRHVRADRPVHRVGRRPRSRQPAGQDARSRAR